MPQTNIATDELERDYEDPAEQYLLECYPHEWMRKLDRRIKSAHGPPGAAARYVLYVLLNQADAEGHTTIDRETLASKTGFRNLHSLRNVLEKLEKHGWIIIGPNNAIRVLQGPTKRAARAR